MADLALTKISETATTITLGWTPPPSCRGYVFYADQKRSSTLDGTRNTVKFAKGATSYRVQALGTLAEGTWPAATPPPPTGGKLKWAPPVLSNPVALNITGPGRYQLDDTRDYRVSVNVDQTVPASGGRQAVNFVGGRHIVIIGGKVSLRPTTASGDAADPTAFLIDGGDPNGVVHIEGVDMTGNCNGVTVRTPRTVRVQWCRMTVDSFQGDHSDAHPDAIQIWDGGANQSHIQVDYLTVKSGYTGYSVLMDSPKTFAMFHVNHQGPQGPAVYYGDGKSCVWTGDNLYFKGCKLDDALAGWGVDNCAYEIHGVNGELYTSPNPPTGGDCPPPLGTRPGDWIGYSRVPQLAGITWIQGDPPGGDFVPAGSVGAAYVPKGYA